MTTKTIGFRAPIVCQVVGITYRQLDYWARTELVSPSIQDARGSGSKRLYSYADLVMLAVVARLVSAGMSLKRVRGAVKMIGDIAEDELERSVLVSNGQMTLIARSADDLWRMLQENQSLWAVSVGEVVEELQAALDGYDV